TGLQISGTSTEPYAKWPKNNLIESCVSYNNCDPAQNNADGFAAKLTCGTGNVFRHCIAYSNIDDGWDLFSKIETGPIGSVLIDRCAAFNNGSLLDGSGNGDGNGFKLGGDGISIKHRIINSYAWNNGAAGLTSNSNPSVIADGCVLYGNKGVNITMYGKGSVEPDYSVKNCISVEGFESDSLPSSLLAVVENSFIWDGAQSRHKDGSIFSKDDFLSTDMSLIPFIADNGSIDMRGLFQLK
ncbi:MAG TPA: pectate lyase, partial [Treponemataceae bacterium]|nr:pectate lyase [Treponemataceae bacterium]